ncbi:MAG: chemotaxis response regulator protein-glutamate methylesterase [Candidatus Sedimenticola sp. (ex Thyasira tokunagai)]
MTKKTTVLVIDDSALVRELLREIIPADGDLEVVDTAPDPYVAREKIKKLNPDVLTLDVEMPRMDGITFLHNLMRLRPMPVVMISALTEKGASQTLQALEMGASDFITKPRSNLSEDLEQYGEEIREKIRVAAKSNLRGAISAQGEAALHEPLSNIINPNNWIIGIGASAGGTEAIHAVLSRMPVNTPGIVVCQHMPVLFTGMFASRLNAESPLTVSIARDGDVILPGCVYVAPGDKHLRIVRRGTGFFCRLDDDGPEINRHKPAVDALFHSLALEAGKQAIGVILTGMGRDGAEGLLAMHNQGAVTIAQDEASSLIWGMPGEAVKLNAVDQVESLENIPEAIIAQMG